MSKLWREPTPIEVEVHGEQPALWNTPCSRGGPEERTYSTGPAVLHLNGQRHQVRTIANRWRVDERWHGGPARDYFLVVTDRGMWGIVYHDLVSQAWFLQGVYD